MKIPRSTIPALAIASTILSFLGLAGLLVVVSYTRQQNPEFLQWQWFDCLWHQRSYRRNHPKALLKVKIAKQQFPILPYQSFKYLLIFLFILASGLLLTEGYFYHLEASKVIKMRSALLYPSGRATPNGNTKAIALYSLRDRSRCGSLINLDRDSSAHQTGQHLVLSG